MVLGLRSKNRKGAAFQVDYTVHVQELRPWPPSQSLRTLRSVVLQWENGERNSGSGSPVVPSLADGKIVFNESFKLQVTLLKEAPVKGYDSGTFQKNVLELNLYEPRRDKTVKGQHLGSAVVDLAEHGIIKEAVNLAIPLNCKRSFRNTVLPVLFLKIQPFEKAYHSSSSRESLSKEVSLDKDARESVSALMNEEYAEEAEIASFTDDDIPSSHSSLTHSASAFESNANSPEEQLHNEDDSTLNLKQDAALGNVLYRNDSSVVHQIESSHGSRSIELSHMPENSANGDGSVGNSPQRNLMPVTGKPNAAGIHNSLPSRTPEPIEQEVNCRESESSTNYCQVQGDPLSLRATDDLSEQSRMVSHIHSKYSIRSTSNKVGYSIYSSSEEVKANIVTIARTDVNPDDDVSPKINRNLIENVLSSNSADEDLLERTRDKSQPEYAAEKVNQNNSVEIKCSNDYSNGLPPSVQASNLERTTVNQQFATSEKASENQDNANIPVHGRFPQTKVVSFTSEKLKNMDSVRSPLPVVESGLSNTNDHFTEEVKETDTLEDAHHGITTFNMVAGTDNQGGTGPSSDKHISMNIGRDDKIEELEHRVAMLEAELREAAAIEISLYSFLAEHGSSAQKVHAPARRLSRLYCHASKLSHERRASAARSAVSGLVLVAKACGNDVPRLTFWLSNLVVLRAIVSQGADSSDLQISVGCHPESDGTTASGIQKSSSPLRWSPESKRQNKHLFVAKNHDWENPATFISALQRVEAWIFSRIIESVWWQTLTPYMQSTNENGKPKTSDNMKKGYGRKLTAANQQQANFSTDLWKKAFKDACERLCPVRGGGHECGCLPLLLRLIMEQCVARLDVAMFNAILRESIDEIPTDPVSDPISDSKVLPIPASKSSFSAGAQLKNAIGNWSRWLTDLFGIDDNDDDSPEHENEQDGDRHETSISSKSFHLLNALSDLLMLPKDMLLDESVRKEVCPTFNASIIKRILNSFEPDEFCPDPIPDAVFQALDSEDALENGEEVMRNFPCNASPIVYSPPSVASVMSEIGDVQNQHPLRRSTSSVLRKCHTSDDELEELDSPLALIIMDKSVVETPTFKGGPDVLRFQLLREVWRDDD